MVASLPLPETSTAVVERSSSGQTASVDDDGSPTGMPHTTGRVVVVVPAEVVEVVEPPVVVLVELDDVVDAVVVVVVAGFTHSGTGTGAAWPSDVSTSLVNTTDVLPAL